MKKLKIIALLSLVMLVSITMVACGKNNGNGALDPTLEMQIKQDYLNTYDESYISQGGFTVNDVFLGYLGTYDGWVAVILRLEVGAFTGAMPYDVTIAGFSFSFSYDYKYLVWKDGQFHGWEFAYGEGILSQANIGSIHNNLNK